MGIVILGAGGLAREVFFHLQGFYDDFVFVDDYNPDPKVVIQGKAYPVVTDWDFSAYKGYPFIIGVGAPNAKRILVERATKAGLSPAPTFIHPRAIVQDAVIGVGGIITPHCSVTTNIRIGDYVVLNLNCTVGHDTVIGDYVQANPGCHISGNVVLEGGVSLGTGTAVIEGTRISKDIVTGAQAAVVKDLIDEGTYVGVPAKPIKRSQ
jgi:sugar O-acyltransferase (sialic acid O-acetyltransferase NeuD family)